MTVGKGYTDKTLTEAEVRAIVAQALTSAPFETAPLSRRGSRRRSLIFLFKSLILRPRFLMSLLLTQPLHFTPLPAVAGGVETAAIAEAMTSADSAAVRVDGALIMGALPLTRVELALSGRSR